MKIGDLVGAKYAYINEKGDLKFKMLLGIVTDRAGAIDGTGEYKVFAQNGKHDWHPKDDLFLALRVE